MSKSMLNIKFFPKVLTASFLFSLIFYGFIHYAHASSHPILSLTVNGGNGASVVNGEPVFLEWYIDNAIDCTINNGIGTVDTSVLPVSGSATTTPQPNTTTNYVLSCAGQSPTEVQVNTDTPVVDISIREGSPLVVNVNTGEVDRVRVDWTSTNATRCSDVWWEEASNPTTQVFPSSYNDYDEYETSGTIRFDGSPRAITETTTFYITCYNDNVSPPSEDTNSVTLNVTQAPPPGTPELTFWSNTPLPVVREAINGRADVSLEFQAQNVASCDTEVYYEDGTPIDYSSAYYPYWYYIWPSSALSDTWSSLSVATTTIFEVSCDRPEITHNGTTYPAVTLTEQILVELVLPAGFSTLEEFREAAPAAAVTIDAVPLTVTTNNVTGVATTRVSFDAVNIDYCQIETFLLDGSLYPGYTSNWDGWETWWGGPFSNDDFSESTWVDLATTSILTVNCEREVDTDIFAPGTAAYNNAVASSSVEVTVIQNPIPAPDPVVYMYGNLVDADADTNWNSKISHSGFSGVSGYDDYRWIQRWGSGASTNNSITFPFQHPNGASDTYNVHFRYCDEDDGQSTFRIYTEDDGLIATVVSDRTDSLSNDCQDSGNDSTVYTDLIAQGIVLDDGDEITVECDTPADGERCRFQGFIFGAGDGGIVTSAPLSGNSSVGVEIGYVSERTTFCRDRDAVEIGGDTYRWKGSNSSNAQTHRVIDIHNESVSTTTTFHVTCGRAADSLTDTSQVTVVVPIGTSGLIASAVTVASGECIDITGMFGLPGRNNKSSPYRIRKRFNGKLCTVSRSVRRYSCR